ncbi:MAG: MFS transporter, partial [Alphaproteobacteria bacterium]|nr:MFS transporter [Alphaproteobacteria bacterium]
MKVRKESVMRNIPLIYADTFLRGFIIYAPILIIYMAQVLDSYALGMSLFAITQISSAAFEVPSGIISDKIGRKWTQVAGATGAFLCTFCYAVGIGFPVFVLGAVLGGVSQALFTGNDAAILYDTLKQGGKHQDFQKYRGRAGSLDHFALAISAAVCSGIALLAGLRATVIATTIPMFLSVIVCLFMQEPKVNSKSDTNIFAHLFFAIKQVFKNKKLRLLTFGNAIIWG